MAERERIQKEIEDLERTLGPDASLVDIQGNEESTFLAKRCLVVYDPPFSYDHNYDVLPAIIK